MSGEPAIDGGPDDPDNPPALRVGDAVPAFELPGIDGTTGERRTYSSAAFGGRPLVIAFYPADDTPVCTRQLVSYTRDIGLLDVSGAQLVAISPQDPASHARFAEANGGFAFPLLSDVDKAVGRRFGIIGLLGLYRRSTFVVGSDGRVVGAHRAIGPGLSYRPLDDLVAKLG